MQSRFIKTAIALSISAISSVSFAAEIQYGAVTIDDKVIGSGSEAAALASSTNSSVVIVGEGNQSALSNDADNDLVILGKEIKIDSTGSAIDTISWKRAGDLKIGESKTQTETVQFHNSSTQSGYAALFIRNDKSDETPQDGVAPSVTVTAKNVEFIAPNGVGIWAQNNSETDPRPTESTKVVVDAENTTIKASTGIIAFSNSQVIINGNLNIDAETAIDTRGHSLVNINQDGKGIVNIKGDIIFETPQVDSGKYLESEVNLNLSGAGSSWTGSVSKLYPSSREDNDPYNEVTGMKLTLSDGAQWNPVVINEWTDEYKGTPLKGMSQALNNLELNDGVINVEHGAEQTVEIENLTGTGGTINLTAKTDGKTVESGAVSVQTTAKNTRLAVRARGITADDVDDAQSVMESLNAKVDAQAAKTNIVQEGDIKGEMRMNVTADNKASDVQIQENTKLLSMKGVNAAALVAWRDEVAYTNQRMEFLRDNSHAYGAWAQVYGGESAYDDASVDLTTTTVQVGADATIGDWVAGAAFSYMNGDADMSNGQADTDAYTLSLYASRMFDSGLFVNGLARYGRLSTDATAGNMDGSYDNNAFSLGGNVGYRFTFAEQAFVEPMFGLQYAYVTGDDYKASNGVKVEQDDFDALIASLGVRTGFDFAKDAGKLYARASVNHDFLGEVDGKASKADLAESMYVDLGGTWFTYGVGTQFNITDNLSVWGNVDRTTGGEVSTRYMMNAGLRYVF